MKKLALVDLNSLFVPAYRAASPTEPANVPHDIVVSRIRRIAEYADHVAVAIDCPPYDRAKLYPEYKAHRRATPEELADRDAMRAQLERVAETLRLDGFAVLGVRGLEADDIIATLVHQATDPELRIVIWSGDKDLQQLVGPGVVVQPTRATETGALPNLVDVDGVLARFSVGPELLGDWLAICGDKVDGVPGVPRLGPAGATALLRQYGSLDMVLAAAKADDPEMKPAAKKQLVDYADQARLSRQLVALRTDAPVSIEDALRPRVMQSLPMNRDEEWDGSEEEGIEDKMSDQSMPETNATDAPAESDPAATAAQPTQAPAPRTIEIEQPAPKPQPSAIDSLMQYVPQPGSDAWAAALEPTSPKGAWQIAEKIYNARLFAFVNVEQCFAAIMYGRSLGLGVMTSCKNIHIIKGKFAIHVDLMVGLVRRSPLCEYWQVKETTNERCIIETKRRGNPEPTRLTYTLEDAIAAKLVPRNGGGGGDSSWDKFRRAMIRHGCERELARMEFQDVTGGLYTIEELSDYSDLPTPRAA